jgi:hypothetical protein
LSSWLICETSDDDDEEQDEVEEEEEDLFSLSSQVIKGMLAFPLILSQEEAIEKKKCGRRGMIQFTRDRSPVDHHQRHINIILIIIIESCKHEEEEQVSKRRSSCWVVP